MKISLYTYTSIACYPGNNAIIVILKVNRLNKACTYIFCLKFYFSSRELDCYVKFVLFLNKVYVLALNCITMLVLMTAICPVFRSHFPFCELNKN